LRSFAPSFEIPNVCAPGKRNTVSLSVAAHFFIRAATFVTSQIDFTSFRCIVK